MTNSVSITLQTDGSLKRVSKSGYLSKGLFPGDQGTSTVTAKVWVWLRIALVTMPTF